MQIWVNTLVRNEDRYLWYGVNSVIDYTDRVLLWDTGSSDNTLNIINSLKETYPKKIKTKEVGEVDIQQYTAVRQKMMDESDCDWIINLDGDEVWWNEAIKKTVQLINKQGKYLDSIVSSYINVIGDIFHFQDESAGRYNIDGKVGNITIRAFNKKIKGLKFNKPHGQQGLFDDKGHLLQERDSSKRIWVDGYSFLHFTNVARSARREDDLSVPKRSFKLKYEIGHEFPLNFYYPEVFFKKRPEFVKSVWQNSSYYYKIRSSIETPLKKIKRKYYSSKKSGY